MEDGRRYENMAWRLWGRETFCCAPDRVFTPQWQLQRRIAGDNTELPELSSSVASDDSHTDSTTATTSRSNSSVLRPHIVRHDSAASQARGKHITPINLEKVVSSIREKKTIEPLSPLPTQLAAPIAPQSRLDDNTTPKPTAPATAPIRCALESSSSTVATAIGSEALSSDDGSSASTSTDMSSHSIVHGFDPGRISTSIRSSTNLAPTPILKTSVVSRLEPIKAEPMKKKQATFTLGGSSDEDNNSSFEASYMAKRSSLTDHLQRAGMQNKTTSFSNVVSMTTYPEAPSGSSDGAIESDSEDDSNDDAIEDEDSDEEWEDEDADNDNSGPTSEPEKELFHRVDSRPNLTSRRSLLTSLMHEGDRAKALQNAASRSSPAIRRSRTSTPNGPSTGTSPQEEGGLMMRQQSSRAQPIIMTTSNVHPPALSPRTTRRNMLQTELTQSLRQNLLWERQQKNSTTNAVNKRVQSAVSLPALRRAMTTNDIKSLPQHTVNKSSTLRDTTKNISSVNDYFDQGLQDYHHKGW
jgi:hypothetical protein